MGIDAAPDGSRLYAADWYRNRLLVFDTRPSAGNAAGQGTPVPASPSARRRPAWRPATGAGTVFVAERDDDSVALVDVDAQRVRSRVRVGSHPFALLFDAPRQRLYALNVQSDDVSVLDTRDPERLSVIATVKVGKAPYGAALAADGALHLRDQPA